MSALEFRIVDVEEAGARLLTTCKLAVYADNVVVWPVEGDEEVTLEIQIDDLLSHLTEYWKPIVLRQTYPLGLNPGRPSDLSYQARRRWADLPEDQVAEEDEMLERFVDCHNFARCFAGYFDLPPLWIMRLGDRMVVEAFQSTTAVEFDLAISDLELVGDQIAERLAIAGERWSALIAAWKARSVGEALTFLVWSTNLEMDTARSFAEEGLLRAPESLAEAANDNDEVRLAARMASALPPEQIRVLLELVADFPKVDAIPLKMLAEASRAFFHRTLQNARPFEQGEGLANFVRASRSLRDDDAIDVFDFTSELGVDLHVRGIAPPTLDALAVSGAKHGPSVLLNFEAEHLTPGIRFNDDHRARATLAHELCHLIIDGENTLGVVDVLRGLMPLAIEQRARAFAAQLLLPSRGAVQVWMDLGRLHSRDGLIETLNELRRRYGVSHSVAAWKLEHGARAYGENLSAMLSSIVPNR